MTLTQTAFESFKRILVIDVYPQAVGHNRMGITEVFDYNYFRSGLCIAQASDRIILMNPNGNRLEINKE